ncbi:hypothetical protein WICPIJ_000738 [Wickerhamomyces pijperi]|uniref:PIN domain-containing protein n=1 Tax=Wickerhamomyces pijperi TaxID=599730 RepID=A0A9P8QCX0_WICPI|nr:hypothetical protein WICPIJ_000738 [Wickerhamomyces pijperi]
MISKLTVPFVELEELLEEEIVRFKRRLLKGEELAKLVSPLWIVKSILWTADVRVRNKVRQIGIKLIIM